MRQSPFYSFAVALCVCSLIACDRNAPPPNDVGKPTLSTAPIAEEAVPARSQKADNTDLKISQPPDDFAVYNLGSSREVVLKAWDACVTLLRVAERDAFELSRMSEQLRFGDQRVAFRYSTQFFLSEKFLIAGGREVSAKNVIGGEAILDAARDLSDKASLIAINTMYVGNRNTPITVIDCWWDKRLVDAKSGSVFCVDELPDGADIQGIPIAETVGPDGTVLRRWWFLFVD